MENAPEFPKRDMEDHGADTQFRYRYQATCAAIYSLLLLRDPQEYDTLYCELLEDILLRRPDGEYVGIQVKTRKEGLGPFKATEEDIIHSLRKFVKLDLEYPNRFCKYMIVTNCGFWNEKQDGGNLEYLLDLCKNQPEDPAIHEKLSRLISQLVVPGGSAQAAIAVLQKTEVDRVGNLGSIKTTCREPSRRVAGHCPRAHCQIWT